MKESFYPYKSETVGVGVAVAVGVGVAVAVGVAVGVGVERTMHCFYGRRSGMILYSNQLKGMVGRWVTYLSIRMNYFYCCASDGCNYFIWSASCKLSIQIISCIHDLLT